MLLCSDSIKVIHSYKQTVFGEHDSNFFSGGTLEKETREDYCWEWLRNQGATQTRLISRRSVKSGQVQAEHWRLRSLHREGSHLPT